MGSIRTIVLVVLGWWIGVRCLRPASPPLHLIFHFAFLWSPSLSGRRFWDPNRRLCFSRTPTWDRTGLS
uniref:Putative secreted protein n=1 Tax=Anopheles triannulatus TaxID=58253 RepID=A0A2M4B7X2_9DIPT